MRPAALLGDVPSCSRRASAGLLRSQQCQPGRSGRLARVVPATAPPSSPASSSSSAQSATPVDPSGQQARPGNSTQIAQKPHSASQSAQSHTSSPSASTSGTPYPTNASPAAAAPTSPTSPPSSPAAPSPRDSSRTSLPQSPILGSGPPSATSPTAAAAIATAAEAPHFVPSSQPGLTPQPLFPPQTQLQPPADSRVIAPAEASGAAKADTGTTLLEPFSAAAAPADSPLPSSNGLGGNGRGNGSAASAASVQYSISQLSSVMSQGLGKPNGGSGAKQSSEGQQPASSSTMTPNATAMGISTGAANGDDAAGGPTVAVSPQMASSSNGKQLGVPTTAAAASMASGAASASVAQPPTGGSNPTTVTVATAPPSTGESSAGSGATAPAVPPGQGGSSLPASGGQPSSMAAAPASAAGVAGVVAATAAQAAGQAAAASAPASPGVAPAASPGSPSPPSSLASSSGNAAAVAAAPAVPGAAGAGATADSAAVGSGTGSGVQPQPAPSPPSAAPISPSPSSPAPSAAQAAPSAAANINSASSGFQLRPIHVVIFAALFLGGALFTALTVQFINDVDFQAAATTIARRVTRSVAFRQLCVIACAIFLVRFGLNNVLRALAKFSSNPVQWDKSKVYYILKEVYQPLEVLLFIAAVCTIADSFVSQVITVPRSTVITVVRSTLSVSFIIGAAVVVFNLKSRFCKENAWQSEMNGDVTAQRRWEAYDKLGTFIIYTITFVLGIQALGLEVTSVLAIGGIGGLAIGLAGREICENILNGFLIMSTSPFEVGDEVHFFHSNKVVEGMVLDIGWYRTTIRSYEREVFVIPNAVFSKNIVLNITRKNREWRFFELICVRVQDVHKVNAIIQDIRRIVRNDQRIITKLHRRIFLDKLTHEDCRIYVSFYVEAQNRESFMAAKQDLLLAFVDCVERNGAKLAVPRTTVQVEPEVVEALSPILGAAAAMAAAKVTMDVQQAAGNAAAAAAARALTDGRTITAEVTAVPSTPAASMAAAGGAGGTTATPSRAATGSPGTPAKNGGVGNIVAPVADATVTSAVGSGSGGSGGTATASLPAQGSSKGEGEKAASVVTVPVGGVVGSGTATAEGAAAGTGAAVARAASIASGGADNVRALRGCCQSWRMCCSRRNCDEGGGSEDSDIPSERGIWWPAGKERCTYPYTHDVHIHERRRTAMWTRAVHFGSGWHHGRECRVHCASRPPPWS
ncbi:hypothetical protein Vafri_19341 [Volvox africanus]|uniref:Uncharacterized protein n=1 Tax=Volvox africanus TaxID=51714 RepID=A0A8J4BUN3_9CHLO|nr:hypothetical protein Vafri_19341 [Volvox africanus]